MAGTAPIFYLIPVSQDLVNAVGCGDFPVDETVITRFIPRVPQMGYPPVGMEPLANRHIIFQCFQAFKAFVVFFSLIDYTISHILIGLNANIASNLESDLLDYFPSKL